jgi:predicted regulator of Ras-like GTPase activity (Roadblock/LC7/MglB family)
MKTPAAADIQRWSDEVARDPRSLAFLPLARAYRRQGLRDLAMQLCLRGLEAYPNHADAHGLLALLYLEAGDHQRAADEWSIVLRIDPNNFEALRGTGFCYLEQDQLSKARQALERAALQRPADATMQEALRVLGTRQQLAQGGGASGDVAGGDDPWATAEQPAAADVPAVTESAAWAGAQPETARTAQSFAPAGVRAAPAGELPADPGGLFDDMLGAGPLLGVLLIDAQGLVLAGRFGDDVDGDAAMLGAVLGGAVDEAGRTAALLHLGGWKGILLESEGALLHLAPATTDTIVVLAAKRDTPAGWILRAAGKAVERAIRFTEVYG